jgi:hypothetical protein
MQINISDKQSQNAEFKNLTIIEGDSNVTVLSEIVWLSQGRRVRARCAKRNSLVCRSISVRMLNCCELLSGLDCGRASQGEVNSSAEDRFPVRSGPHCQLIV